MAATVTVFGIEPQSSAVVVEREGDGPRRAVGEVAEVAGQEVGAADGAVGRVRAAQGPARRRAADPRA